MPLPLHFRSSLALAVATLALVSSPASATPSPFSGVYVFGDSLSDNGKLFSLTGGFYPPSPYYQGRFSNGPVAVEMLATALLGAGSPDFHDLAIGGARTGLTGSGDGLIGKPTGMLTQLGQFQTSLGAGGSADAGALYVVWGGANDMRDGLVGGTPESVAASLSSAITNLSTIVYTLHAAGARNFLLPNLPDLGLTPEARGNGAAAAGFASLASETFNTELSKAYGLLAGQWSDEHFYFYNAMQAQRDLTTGAPGNGLTNVSSSCLATLGCTPGSFLYWDDIHPTAFTHQVLAAGMLAAVPEPQTLLMMGIGLLAVLGAGRRRRA